MSTLRPECKDSVKPITYGRDYALRKIYDAVRKRRSLAYGKLHAADGKHCAMGCFWEDHFGAVLDASLVEEVASVNDSVPPTATPKERRKHVLRWLEHKLGI